jgi:hypothetical protein
MRITPPDTINPEVPKPLSKLVLDCVELTPRRRPQTIGLIKTQLALCATAMQKAQS